MTGRARIVAACVALAASARAVPALADDRIATDLALAPELVAAKGSGDARFGVGARGHYLATVGAYARLFPGEHRSGAVGVDARPLFLPRWLKNAEGDRSFFELTVDSLHVSLGARFDRRSRSSFELGGGVELPVFATFHGPYVGVEAMYWAPHGALAGGGGGDWMGVLSVGWRFGVISHAVDVRDRR